MKLFVAGGTGYRGSAVTAALRCCTSATANTASPTFHRDAIATLYAPGVRTAPAGSCYPGANAHSPTMTELATAASRSRRLNGRIAAEPRADSRARPGLFLATFMLLLGITVMNTALPSIQGEES